MTNYVLDVIVNYPQLSEREQHGHVFTSLALLELFLSSGASICSTVAFSPSGNSDHVVISVSTEFPLNSKREAPFHRTASDYSRADRNGLRDHSRDVPWKDIVKLAASAAGIEFCEWIKKYV